MSAAPPSPVVDLEVEMTPVTVVEPSASIITRTKHEDVDPFLVEFRRPHDNENPKDWPSGRKWLVTDSLSVTGFSRIMVSTIMAPALTTIQAELAMTPAEATMALSIYLLATAFGPLVIGPLSEVYGRKRILHASNAWFIIWNIVCGFANTKGLLIAARFMAGFGGSAIYSLGGGVLGDIWRPEQRGKGLRIYSMVTLLGSAVGRWPIDRYPTAMAVCKSTVTDLCSLFRSHYRRFHGGKNFLALDVLVSLLSPCSMLQPFHTASHGMLCF